jgi:hypothetical protein
MAALIYIPTKYIRVSFPAFSPGFIVVCFLDNGHSAWDEMKSQQSFVLPLPYG